MSIFGWLFGEEPLSDPFETMAQRERERIIAIDKGLTGPYGDTVELYNKTTALIAAAEFPDKLDFAKQTGTLFVETCEEYKLPLPHYEIGLEMIAAAGALFVAEGLTDAPSTTELVDDISIGRFRDRLIALHVKAERPIDMLSELMLSLVYCYSAITKGLPGIALGNSTGDSRADEGLSIPLADIIPNIGKVIEEAILPFYSSEAASFGLFKWLHRKLADNKVRATGNSKQPIEPSEYDGTPREIVAAYLRDTPLESIFTARVPFVIPQSRQLEHTAIIAGTGWGKTQLLQNLILDDLLTEDPPAMVILDSTGAMLKRIQRLAVFNTRLKDRLVIIDPEDPATPALNMFDTSNPRLQTYTQSVREEVESEIIGLFQYVFASVASELTTRQGTAFSYIVRLLLSKPGANIHTLREILEDDPKNGYEASAFRADIERLGPTATAFFKNHFYTKSFGATRAQIAQRIYSLVQVPVFDRMFSTVNRLDMYSELQDRGSIILINTSTRLLKEEASPLFGRYMIARVLAAVFERAAIPEEKRRPTMLIIDEAAPYFDETFDSMLTRVRQYKLGVTIAFQHLEQASDKLRSSIASNTSIKFAGGLGYSDSRWLAREMRTSPEFLQAQKRDARDPPKWTQFACYVRNYTDAAVSLTIPIGSLEAQPTMSEHEMGLLLLANRLRVSYLPPAPTPTPAPPPAPGNEAPTITTPPRPAAITEPPAKPNDPDAGIHTDAATNWR